MEGCFIDKYDPTIEDSYQKVIQLSASTRCQLDILDTAGTDQFAAMRDLYMRDGDVFILVYSITSTLSFEEVKQMHDQLERVNPIGAANALIVGNKCDLEIDRVVSTGQAESMATLRNIPFIETSAKNGTNVDDAFAIIPRKIIQSAPTKKARKSCCTIV